MYDKIARILIVRTDRIGDVILTLPMAAVLKRHYPKVRISMLIRRYTSELVRNDPNVDGFICVDNEHGLIPFARLVREVKEGNFDVVFHTHPRFRFALLTWLARIPRRVGTGFRWYSLLFNSRVYEHRKDAKFHELEYNLHLLDALGVGKMMGSAEPTILVSDALNERMGLYLRSLGVKDREQIVILHPGSGGSARNWSPEKFGSLARRLSEVSNIRLIVTGGEGEERIARTVFEKSGPRALQFVNTFSIMEYAALVRRGSLFIANSTGPLHIAAAVGTPVIGFYPQQASLSVARWGPYTRRRMTFTPEDQPPDCTRCVSRSPKLCECMDTIPVDSVFDAALRLLRDAAVEAEEGNASPAGKHASNPLSS